MESRFFQTLGVIDSVECRAFARRDDEAIQIHRLPRFARNDMSVDFCFYFFNVIRNVVPCPTTDDFTPILPL